MSDYDDQDQFSDYVPSSDEKKEMMVSLIADFLSLERKLWDTQRKISSDGSCGFTMARQRLLEARMWAKRDMLGPDNV